MQPAGFIMFTLFGGVCWLFLAVALSVTADVLYGYDSAIHPAIVHATKAAIAFLLWLPAAYHVLRKQVRSLAQDEQLPASIRPERAAWIFSLVTIGVVAFVDFMTEGNWGNRRHPDAGYGAILYFYAPFLVWAAIRWSSDPPVPGPADWPANRPQEPAREVLPEGKTRDDVLRFLGFIDRADELLANPQELEPHAPDERLLLEAQASSQVPPDATPTLKWNLALAATAYADAMRIVEATALVGGKKVREEIASKYLDAAEAASGELELVIAVGRRARDCAAAEAGLIKGDIHAEDVPR